MATRNRSEEVLNALAGIIPEIVGGSADLSGSNLTVLKVLVKLELYLSSIDRQYIYFESCSS